MEKKDKKDKKVDFDLSVLSYTELIELHQKIEVFLGTLNEEVEKILELEGELENE